MSVDFKDELAVLFERLRTWPRSKQQNALSVLHAMEAESGGTYVLSDEERADLEVALDEVARGEVASAEEVARTFDRYR